MLQRFPGPSEAEAREFFPFICDRKVPKAREGGLVIRGNSGKMGRGGQDKLCLISPRSLRLAVGAALIGHAW